MLSSEISEQFTAFFENQGYKLLASAPLLHPSIPMSYVMSAGLVQIETALNEESMNLDGRYVLTQKCFRHFDVEKIGWSSAHLSLFHMPGAFSFGPYNQGDSIDKLYFLLTDVLNIDKNRLWITYFSGEDSPVHNINRDLASKEAWLELGVNSQQIYACSARQNLWQQGGGIKNEITHRKLGLSTEVFFDRGRNLRCDNNCKPGCKCSRFVELANILFVSHQLDTISGKYAPLSIPFSETVIGSERLAMILQGKESIFDIDCIVPLARIIDGYSVSKSLNKVEKSIIIDHIRALAYLVADGAPPPNKDGRQRIIRKLIRKLLAQFIILSIPIYDCIEELLQVMEQAIKTPVESNWQHTVLRYVESEELKFQKTVSLGRLKLSSYLESNDEFTLTSQQILGLEKQDGLPADLTRYFLSQLGLPFPEKRYLSTLEAWNNAQNKKA